MWTALALSHVAGSMQACTCRKHGMQKASCVLFIPYSFVAGLLQMSSCPAFVQERDQNRVRGMRIMLERQTRAAGAAASADSDDAAKTAAEAQLLPPRAAAAAPEEAAPSGGPGAAASSSAFAGDFSCASPNLTQIASSVCTSWVRVACLPHTAA